MMVLRILLLPFSGLYGVVTALRRMLYRRGLMPVWRAAVPVISVGNLAAGGSGKTPLTLWLAKRALARGWRVAVVSRGYRRKSRGPLLVSDGKNILCDTAAAGDEPMLMARLLPGLIVGVSEKRAGIMGLIQREHPVDLFIMDDGFQHLAVHRDRDIVLHDFDRPLWQRWPLPSGLMRGFSRELRHAHLLLNTSAKPVAGTVGVTFAADGFFDGHDMKAAAGGPGRAMLFSSIARPDRFYRTVQSAEGIEIAGHVVFADHHFFSAADMRKIITRATGQGCALLICTTKDWVKIADHPSLTELIRDSGLSWLVARQKLIFDDPQAMTGLLDKLPLRSPE